MATRVIATATIRAVNRKILSTRAAIVMVKIKIFITENNITMKIILFDRHHPQ